ncbi:CPBP family intramembrane glutamic endopeptidase [Umezawaea sp. Da 62-37]|uniref:CPBP family intramembrane glutamic endopeptidase n=1 Tax=Umezawaea sp. Da 62-37 TaxID=3075927 RepID=UPI0028F723DE|nr:CPBP family intramembrane glutamic endopeptidase [Umezawaea sp. Da 62-37]WNV88754.1 CPBP family intramembrane glutamic endopeptidase [Umezawaea sp. Da 62-37]
MWRDASGSVRTGWKVAGFLALSAASVVVAAFLAGMFGGGTWQVVALAAVLVLGLTRIFEGKRPRARGTSLAWFAVGSVVGTALVCGLAWGLMLHGVLYWVPNRAFTGPVALTGTAYFFFAVLVEELVFRGYALRRLADSLGPKVAVGLLAVGFGGYHLVNLGTSTSVKSGGLELLWTAAGPAIGAVVFGVAALRTKGIALPVGLHLGWNWTQWQFFSVPGDDTPMGLWSPILVPTANPIAFQVGYVVAMAVALAAVLLATRRDYRPENSQFRAVSDLSA